MAHAVREDGEDREPEGRRNSSLKSYTVEDEAHKNIDNELNDFFAAILIKPARDMTMAA